MKLYEFEEQSGPRSALSPEESIGHHPALAGWWLVKGTIDLDRGDEPYKGASSEQIFDAIDSEGVFVWTATNAVPRR